MPGAYITVTVRYFGPAKRFTGNKSMDTLQMTLTNGDYVGPRVLLANVLEQADRAHGNSLDRGISAMVREQRFGVAVNGDYITYSEENIGEAPTVGDNDEVLVIPPVLSG